MDGVIPSAGPTNRRGQRDTSLRLLVRSSSTDDPEQKASLERRGRRALLRVAGLGISPQKLGDVLVLESRLVQTSERYKIFPH